MQIELKSVRGGSTATQMSTPLPPPPPHRPLPIRSPSRTSQPQPSLESPGWRGARHTLRGGAGAVRSPSAGNERATPERSDAVSSLVLSSARQPRIGME
eukprot:scaffold90233_cov32-Tisochrysis_lutea.AAC.4